MMLRPRKLLIVLKSLRKKTHLLPFVSFATKIVLFATGAYLVPVVLRLFGQRLVTSRDPRELGFYYRRISGVKQ